MIYTTIPIAFTLALCLTSALAFGTKLTKEAENDRVHSLPGVKSMDFDMFSGYITVDEDAGRALFYTLVESTSSPESDPLVLWLNGGPGCSSMGGGLMSELGPFYPTPTGEHLIQNDYAWNRVANMLFLDSPAFVGWSYSNRSEDIVVGDKRTAIDSLEFLFGFLDRFPEYRGRTLWLSGESYAGHYLPNLALEIVRHNEAAPENAKLNFKGFLLGNALTVPEIDSAGAVTYWYTHGIISDTSYRGIMDNCDFEAIYPLDRENKVKGSTSDVTARMMLQRLDLVTLANKHKREERCAAFIEEAMANFEDINIYDVYADVCLRDAPGKQLARVMGKHPAGLAFRAALSQPRYDPCIDDEVERYFNRRDVQDALHANLTGAIPGPWTSCNPAIEYSRDDVLASMLPVYDKLLKSGIKMLLYTGDVDAIVPIIGTRKWIRDLDLKVEEAWRPWRSVTGQVGGWTVQHEKGLSFASVRGAGHMVPYTRPERAFYLFSQWVHEKPL